MSTTWVASLDLNGNVQIAPMAWVEDAFWDRYDSEYAVEMRVFDELMAKISAE